MKTEITVTFSKQEIEQMIKDKINSLYEWDLEGAQITYEFKEDYRNQEITLETCYLTINVGCHP